MQQELSFLKVEHFVLSQLWACWLPLQSTLMLPALQLLPWLYAQFSTSHLTCGFSFSLPNIVVSAFRIVLSGRAALFYFHRKPNFYNKEPPKKRRPIL